MKTFKLLWVGALVLVAGLVTAPSLGRAQDSQPVRLNQYRPAPSITDGFVISRPDDRGHLLFGARLDLDYALNPLVVERTGGDSSTEAGSLVEHQFAAHLNLSMGLFDRLVIFAGLPVDLVQSGQSFGTLPAGGGAGLGDLFLGVRGRIWGEQGDDFSIGAQLVVTMPTAGAANSAQRYSGERGATFVPTLLVEARPHEAIRITGNLGARIRTDSPAVIANVAVGQELTWGLGLTVDAVRDLLRLYVEGYGSASFDSNPREVVPFELLGGGRVEVMRGLEVGLGLGTGLTRGYGTPDFRGVLTVGYAQPREAAAAIGDRDGDGLLDNVDRCPDEPEDRDGFEDEEGCPDPDNDRDGILDVNDRCPVVPGVPENQGCPAVEIREDTGQIYTLERIEFETDSDVILPSSIHIVENVRNVLRDHPEINLVRIEGHTDDRAADDHNLDLSRRRARSVVLWLAGNGIRPERMEAYGCGELHPIAPNATEEGRQNNRRVEFHIAQPGAQDVRRGCQQIDLR